jgi:hypothetical protein
LFRWSPHHWAGIFRNVTPEERARAGRAVAQRIADLSLTFTAVTATAGIDPKTLRGIVSGARWPTAGVRVRVEQALDWPPGEILRRAGAEHSSDSALDRFTSTELLVELLHRATAQEQQSRVARQSERQV